MYYQERIINGKLHARTRPTGEWVELHTPRAVALKALIALTPEDRNAVLGHFTLA